MRATLVFLCLVILAPFLRSGPFVDEEAVAQKRVSKGLVQSHTVANSGPGFEPKADGTGSKVVSLPPVGRRGVCENIDR